MEVLLEGRKNPCASEDSTRSILSRDNGRRPSSYTLTSSLKGSVALLWDIKPKKHSNPLGCRPSLPRPSLEFL